MKSLISLLARNSRFLSPRPLLSSQQRALWLVFGGLCLLVSVLPAAAATYYVATTGSDSNPGTIDLPFRTIQKGANTEVAGDTLYVRGGVYFEGTVFVGHFSGTASAPIRVLAYPGEKPIIDGNNYALPNTSTAGTDPLTGNTYVWNALLHISGSYHIVSGFEIRFSHGRGITIIGDNNQAIACYVHDCRQQGIIVNGASNVTVANCTVSGAGNFAPYERAGGSPAWPAALASAANATNVLIQGCTVFNNWGEGIGPYSSSYVTVEDCVVYDNFAAEIYLEHTRFATIQRNLVYGTNTAPWLRNGMPCPGILIGDESFNTAALGTDYTIVNNLVAGCGRDIAFWNGGSTGTGLKNTLIAYNTLADSYDATRGCLDIATGSHSNTLIEDNIVRQSSAALPVVTVPQTSGLSFTNNLWSRAVSGIASTSTDVIGDPQLAQTGPTGPGAWTPDWFKLQFTSPARSRGKAVAWTPMQPAELTKDYFGTVRDSTPDMGGDEFDANALVVQLEQQLTDADNLVASLQSQLTAACNQVTQLNAELTAANSQIAQLTSDKADLTDKLAVANLALQTANRQIATLQAQVTNNAAQLQALGANLGSAFGDPGFAIPGGTVSEQLANLAKAVGGLNHGQQQALYFNLGGVKK